MFCQLLENFKKDHPEIYSKMKKLWVSVNHTADQKTLWCKEILKHDSLGYSYWIEVMELAAPFFSEEGVSIFLKIMEEEGFVMGTFKCNDLQAKFGDRIGNRVLTTYKTKGTEKLYPEEIGLMFDDGNTVDHPLVDHKDKEFVLDGPRPNILMQTNDKVLEVQQILRIYCM